MTIDEESSVVSVVGGRENNLEEPGYNYEKERGTNKCYVPLNTFQGYFVISSSPYLKIHQQ